MFRVKNKIRDKKGGTKKKEEWDRDIYIHTYIYIYIYIYIFVHITPPYIWCFDDFVSSGM